MQREREREIGGEGEERRERERGRERERERAIRRDSQRYQQSSAAAVADEWQRILI